MSGPTRKSEVRAGDADSIDTTHGALPSGPSLDRGIQAQIGDRLRSLYGELSEQPVPDRLIAILDQLSSRR